MATKKEQRIKMRIHKHPVKHDGKLIAFNESDGSFRVEFDGPINNKTFYPYGREGHLVADKAPIDAANGGKNFPADTELWEVL